jgi:integrative and conjugative element protein (TIGR02256 family)
MSGGVVEFGQPLADQDPEHLKIPAARRTALAVLDHPDFRLIELRGLNNSLLGDSEILIVECSTDKVWSQNSVGILFREPLALRFFKNPACSPEVRALRSVFPVTLHQNHVTPGEPASLCLYFGPWSATSRSWTPERHLARIEWWLAEIANGTLHRSDQPPEQLYFESRHTFVLPPDFEEKVGNKDWTLSVQVRTPKDSDRRVIVGTFKPLAERDAAPRLACIALTLPTVHHGPVERFPIALGELHDQFERRGAPFVNAMFAEIQRVAEGTGLPAGADVVTLLVLSIPVVKDAGDTPRIETRGFLIALGLGPIGELAQVLHRMNNKYYKATLLNGAAPASEWRDIAVELVEVVSPLTVSLAQRYSGVTNGGPNGLIAGLGALGSEIANIWARQGWGRWSYIDPDLLLPHNLARHAGYEPFVGWPKVDVVREMARLLYPSVEPGLGIHASANAFENPKVKAAIESAQLVVDLSTTFEVPRDLGANDCAGRSVSAFVTPSGQHSALLMENASRTVRLDVLEAQYYRFVISAPWGCDHLAGHAGDLWVGAGCRDVSFVISTDLVEAHAALLARQIRIRSEMPDAAIQVWRLNPRTGAIETSEFIVSAPLFSAVGHLRVAWDEGLRSKIRHMREKGLPKETGGVLLGYFDMTNEAVYVVDALPAPSDSQRGSGEFIRGVEGLEAVVEEANRRTGKVVTYVGEWHTHPRGVAPLPSVWDVDLMVHLATLLHRDGLPALMLIVGDAREQWLVGSVR